MTLHALRGANAGGTAPRTHVCVICGKEEFWGPSWSWYGSEALLDTSPKDVPRVCSRRRSVSELQNPLKKPMATTMTESQGANSAGSAELQAAVRSITERILNTLDDLRENPREAAEAIARGIINYDVRPLIDASQRSQARVNEGLATRWP